jgi:hypothetical protein
MMIYIDKAVISTNSNEATLKSTLCIRKWDWCCGMPVSVRFERPPLWSGGQSSWLHNGDVLCFLWGTNWIYICYVEESRPPLWFSGQSSWLHNGDVLCFLWGTNWIYICYVEESRRLCGLVVRVPGYTTEMYCASCEIRTEFIYVM